MSDDTGMEADDVVLDAEDVEVISAAGLGETVNHEDGSIILATADGEEVAVIPPVGSEEAGGGELEEPPLEREVP